MPADDYFRAVTVPEKGMVVKYYADGTSPDWSPAVIDAVQGDGVVALTLLDQYGTPFPAANVTYLQAGESPGGDGRAYCKPN